MVCPEVALSRLTRQIAFSPNWRHFLPRRTHISIFYHKISAVLLNHIASLEDRKADKSHICDQYHNLALRDPFCFKMRPGQRVLACLSRTAVASSRTTSFSSVRCIVRLVGTLCFFDNFRPQYGEFNDLCPKTIERGSAPNYASLRQDMQVLPQAR